MRRDGGIVGITVLWILAALTAMAGVALAAGRLSASRSRLQWNETRALALLQSGLSIARDAEFEPLLINQSMGAGIVTVERLTPVGGEIVRVRAIASIGEFKMGSETGWRRSGRGWLALYWSEL